MARRDEAGPERATPQAASGTFNDVELSECAQLWVEACQWVSLHTPFEWRGVPVTVRVFIDDVGNMLVAANAEESFPEPAARGAGGL
jgi:hypothetical protein